MLKEVMIKCGDGGTELYFDGNLVEGVQNFQISCSVDDMLPTISVTYAICNEYDIDKLDEIALKATILAKRNISIGEKNESVIKVIKESNQDTSSSDTKETRD